MKQEVQRVEQRFSIPYSLNKEQCANQQQKWSNSINKPRQTTKDMLTYTIETRENKHSKKFTCGDTVTFMVPNSRGDETGGDYRNVY